MTANRTDLLDHLRDTDYDPKDEDWYGPFGQRTENFELAIPSVGTLKVVIFPGDDYRVDVHALDTHGASEWTMTFSSNTPDWIIIAALTAAGSGHYTGVDDAGLSPGTSVGDVDDAPAGERFRVARAPAGEGSTGERFGVVRRPTAHDEAIARARGVSGYSETLGRTVTIPGDDPATL